jgi:hypothetical protein
MELREIFLDFATSCKKPGVNCTVVANNRLGINRDSVYAPQGIFHAPPAPNTPR